MSKNTATGLLVLHGNRLELLAEAVLEWLAANPLPPLEQETLLVQSNGMGEWLKMTLAEAQGVCAATTVELPARFIWRAYRAVLGRETVPAHSALDKLPLTWRLMSLLPSLAGQAGFEPVAGFLGNGDPARRLQLAQRLADLFDQYQVYRADWLQDWGLGKDRLRAAAHADPQVPPEQRWQPALWRALLSSLPAGEQDASRAALHRRFIAALRAPSAGAARAFPELPRRVVLFGTTHIPHQALEAIAALAEHCQVLLAVPNPCRYHWAELIDGRELLQAQRRRHPWRAGRDLSQVALQDMHAHGHPLLAAWGRQSRDFIRQLDAFDDAEAARRQFALPRIDLFDETPSRSLLQHVQAAVRDLLPLAEHPRAEIASEDRSIVFQVAHSPQREVEILHDQLLALLAAPPEGSPLAPRDIVVMVPDIDRFAPAIRSVFGQHGRHDPRHIPWGIADQNDRGRQPLLVALEWLLRAPHERFGASQVRDLLEVPALAARFGIPPEALPALTRWIEGAGIRWGLNAAQREALGLAAAGEQNSWVFGLRRMLLGYAVGDLPAGEDYAGIDPYAEVAGLDASLAGSLDALLRALTGWWAQASQACAPARWAQCLRDLLLAFFAPTDDTERALLLALNDTLARWLEACEAAGYQDALDIAVVREAWLDALDEPGMSRRFRAGGVTFCTLLPLRAIPFQVVCLLGMNDADYPRRGSRIDFDLMALPGQARPGDRSRRDDDRQLMLDALLSARRVLYISWGGRSQRDNQPQPPSVLVSQLRDYLAAVWGQAVVAQRTTEHPLQPFSRRYFEAPSAADASGLFTHATEWREAHLGQSSPASIAPALPGEAGGQPLTLPMLVAFLRNPVKAFFRHRLQVLFTEGPAPADDDEVFSGQGLTGWAWIDELLQACQPMPDDLPEAASEARIGQQLDRQIARLQRAGRLPIAGPGRRAAAALHEGLTPMLTAWRCALAGHPAARGRLRLRIEHPQDATLVLDDWLPDLRLAHGDAAPVWIRCRASKLIPSRRGAGAPAVRADKLLEAWVLSLASAACGTPVEGILIGEDALVRVRASAMPEAPACLHALMLACREGLNGSEPLPTALLTGITYLADPRRARDVFEGNEHTDARGEGEEPCLARLFPDFAALQASPGFESATRRLYEPYRRWLDEAVSFEALGATATEPEALDD